MRIFLSLLVKGSTTSVRGGGWVTKGELVTVGIDATVVDHSNGIGSSFQPATSTTSPVTVKEYEVEVETTISPNPPALENVVGKGVFCDNSLGH